MHTQEMEQNQLAKILKHLQSEEETLSQIAKALQAVRFSHRLANFDGERGSTSLANANLLQKLIAIHQKMTESRHLLIDDLARTLEWVPEQVTLSRLLKHFELEDFEIGHRLVAEKISILRRRAARVLGTLQASIWTMLTERQLLEISFQALGGGIFNETYTATGTRNDVSPRTFIETRA